MSELRRQPEADETLVRCAKCGRVELPVNARELWNYARTGEGLGGPPCPKHPRGWHKWRAA